jgi:hypothetical protein
MTLSGSQLLGSGCIIDFDSKSYLMLWCVKLFNWLLTDLILISCGVQYSVSGTRAIVSRVYTEYTWVSLVTDSTIRVKN